ncbi:MAG: hypothetical protein ACKVQC_07430 [Elusimicrobiota bacterium]
MDFRDLIITPFYIFIFYFIAYLIRPYVTDQVTRAYYFPALSLKIFGALMLGLIYQFYYGGGDTFNFHTHGSRHIWEAFFDSPEKWFELMTTLGSNDPSVYKYTSQIPFFRDQSSYMVIRVAAFFDLFTVSAYSATACLFARVSFVGGWMFFLTFYRRYPQLHRQIAFAALFIPSVFFWGSGLLKDTLMMAFLGIMIYEIDALFFRKKITISSILLLILSIWFIFAVKKFILQAFLPAALLWIYLGNLKLIKQVAIKVVIFPLIVVLSIFSIYYSVVKVGEGDRRYAVENIANTARTTAYDIRFQTGRDAGSGYTLGELDGTFGSMLRLAPQAINVSLFRPYLWEVNNPLMLLSALESLFFLAMTLYLIFKYRLSLIRSFSNPDFTFAFVFSIVYAFAVGISSFNFGTLSRYKIPLMPFYALVLIFIYYENKPRKVEEFEETE